jgi:hypothetical protein
MTKNKLKQGKFIKIVEGSQKMSRIYKSDEET